MPNFVDTFLQALPQGAQAAQNALQLKLQEEQIKDARKKEKEQEDAAQALSMLKVVQERDDLRSAFQQAIFNSAAAELAAQPAIQNIISSAQAEQFKRQAEERAALATQERVKGALSAIKGERPREVAESLIDFELLGADLPLETQKRLFPDLFPEGVDPTLMNSALRGWALSGESWGTIKREFGLPTIPGGIPDDLVAPFAPGRTSKLNDRQATATMHYQGMTFNDAIISGLEDQGVGLTIPGQAFRVLTTTQSSSGGITGLLSNLAAAGFNWVLPEEQQRLIDSQLKFANHYRFMISGMQSSDREFMIILNSVASQVGDKPPVIAQKRAFRKAMTEAALALSKGEMSPTQAVESVQAAASGMILTPELVQVLEQQRKDAEAFERKNLVTPPYLSRDSSQTDDDMIADMIRNWVIFNQ